MARTPVVFGNWKLNKTIGEALDLVTAVKNQLASVRDVDIGVAPVFVALAPVARRLEDSNLHLAGQNCYFEDRGAFTGEVAPSLLRDAGCSHVILGHSERRHVFGETDQGIGKKVRAALDAGLVVILCIGEKEDERDAGQTTARCDTQLAGGLAHVETGDLDRVIIAYEPVWAIGTGRTATPAQTQEVHAHVRGWLRERYGDVADDIRIQYGGSVKPGNAAELMAQPDIDGALVGGASLKADDFAAIVKAARPG